MTHSHASMWRAAALAMAALATVAGAALGQGKSPSQGTPLVPAAPRHAPFSGDLTTPMGIPLAPPPAAWLTRHWPGDSKPFDAAARTIRAEGRRLGDTQAVYERILGRERAAALDKPLDLLAHFRWLYAATQVAYTSRVVDPDVLTAVGRLDPGTYRTMARTRYAAVVLAEPFKAHPELAGLEDRLMRSDLSDDWVRDHAIRDLANGRATLPKAAALADRWVRDAPVSPKAHGVRAFVAQTEWFWGHRRDRAVAERAVAEYGQFLRLAPPGDPGRRGALRMSAMVAQAAGIPVAAAHPR